MSDKILLCCGKGDKYLVQGEAKTTHDGDVHNPFNFNWELVDKGYETESLNGKIIAEANWELDDIEYIFKINYNSFGVDEYFVCKKFEDTNLLRESRSTITELCDKLDIENDPCGNVIFVEDLHAYIRPHNISECLKIKKGMRDMCYGYFNPSLEGDTFNYLKSIPKRIQKVWLAEYDQIKPYFIITVSPEEACRILNGKQTAIVTRELPKEMIKQWKNG